ncbi:hypothetical protein ACFE04_012870 [Oxalis oulophora]
MTNFDYHQILFEEAEEEDTLSFCDLAMDNEEDEKYSKGEETSSSFDHQDFFKFSSPSKLSSSDNILFCGELISYKGDGNPYLKSKQFDKLCHVRSYNKTGSTDHGYNDGKRHYYSVKKVSIIATHVKSSSKWPFGVGKSPVEMEFTDINKRSTIRSNDEKKNVNERDRKLGKALCGLLNALMFKKRHSTTKFLSI